MQAQLYTFWAEGGEDVCAALEAGFVGDWKHCFYQAGRAKMPTLPQMLPCGTGNMENGLTFTPTSVKLMLNSRHSFVVT